MCHPDRSGPIFSSAPFCGASGRAVEGSLRRLSLVFPSLLSLFPLRPLCSSLRELCVTVPLLFISYSPSETSPALIFPVAKCAINSRFAAKKSYCPNSRGNTHSTLSNAAGAISPSATAAEKK